MPKAKLVTLENLERFKANLENTYGKPEGIAVLDSSGHIPVSQLPPIDAGGIIEYDDVSEFPVEGATGIIYVDISTNTFYRWDETSEEYVSVSSPDAVKFTEQILTSEQQAQARANIGAVSADEIPEGSYVRYDDDQDLTSEEQEQARSNIDAVSSSELSSSVSSAVSTALTTALGPINSDISSLQAAVQTLGDNVSDVVKVEDGLRVDYANGTSKLIEIETDLPIKSVVYDENHYLHFYDENGNDLFDNVYIEGGGGGGGATGGYVRITRVTNESVNCVYGASVPIEFSVVAKDSSDDNATLNGSTWSVNNIIVARNVNVTHGNNTFDIGPYLNVGNNTIKVSVSADLGGDSDVIATKTWKVNAVNMRFEWNYDDTQINTTAFTDSWIVYGDVEKTSHTKVGETELATTVTSKTGATQSIVIPNQLHGSYGVERWLTATIGGEPQRTASQYHEMIFATPGDHRPIIAVSLKDIEMNQYDTIRIPVVIYDPSSVLADATLYVDGNEIGSWDNIDRSVQYWSYTPTNIGSVDQIFDEEQTPISGVHVLSIRCGTTERTIPVRVNAVTLDVEEVPGYTFRFKSSDFASNSAVQNWESNGIDATFSNNFDWVNGGLKTETDDSGNLQQYFCIKAGTWMTINHKLFESDPKSYGMTFKIIYKVKNCRNYEAKIADCYSNVGLQMYAHNAVFNSTGTTVNVPYGEDEYTELEFDVYPVSGFRYMMAWIDGVITSCRVYDSNDSFTHAIGSQKNIVLGSDDCDVYIYMVKAYPRLVTRDGHIDNFIMDAPNATEMALRYNRNHILDEGGDISPTELARNNPDCRVWMYDVPYITNSKDDKVSGCDFTQIWTDGDQYYQISGSGKMSIQGTSSVNYRRGAANTDINFSSLEDGYGNNLLAGGVKDESYGGSNNWYTEDPDNPGHAKQFTVLDAKIAVGIRRTYTVQQALAAARVQDVASLGQEWVVYEEDDQQNPVKFINTNDVDAEGTLGPEWIVIERDNNRNPVKYIRALGIKLTDNSCPITYSNTKVNFASCEQVNNMCNAAWYQMYNPYPSLTPRDCMEFVMGVQFIKDSGEIPDDSHYVLWGDNKYHMYSIANMGNSKKNVHVFHDLSNPNEVCIEVNDNNDDQMRMVNPNNLSYEDYFAEETWNGKKYYGMRYPDTKNPSSDIVNAWYRLVWWMACNDPSRPTGELLPEPETYGDYTFRGHDRDGLQVLRGTTITQYSGTYTHDTFERRMAKMLSECEDYMVMDSFMYHYVYLERHTMVDNVSKNNFWSSTDLIHWDLSKAYDMDTSDGNNNQGQLVFDYGNEWNDDIGGMKVFNGSDSVWFVFCANLYEACRTMFINRESAGAWSAVAYHNFLTAQQHKVPERCWVECYWYDYLRTYEEGIVGKDDWIPFLDGGQKTHQRKHYEFFEELYDSSKYRGSASTASNINFRAYTPNTWNNYVIDENGTQLRPTPSMASSGYPVPVGELISISQIIDDEWRYGTYNGHSGYVHKSTLGGIEPNGAITITMYNKMYVSVDAGTKQIEPIKVERGIPLTVPFNTGYINNMLVVVNTASMIQAVSGLEQLYPDTCVFSGATRLRELAIGSTEYGYENTFLRSLALGNNIMLERLYAQNLPNADSALDLSNCPALLYLDTTGSGFTAYTFADGGLITTAIINKPTSLSLVNLSYLDDNTFVIADCSALISLRYENTPNVNIYSIVNISPALQIVRLIGVDWLLPNSNILDRLLVLQGLNENNITIPQSVLAGDVYTPSMRQRSLDLYNAAWGSDLHITYDNLVDEFIVYFVNPDGSSVKDRLGNNYMQYVDRGQTIIDPVANNLIDTPTMESTAQYDYTFSGWENITGAVMDNRTVVATYATSTRTYQVRWFATNGALLKTTNAAYGTEVVYEDVDHPFPPVKTDEEANLYFWVFKNWNKSTGYITEDTDVYAIWDRAPLPTVGMKKLKDMSIAEIYAVAKTNQASAYFEDEDYVDIETGKDYDFDNVQSQLLLEERYFNGQEIVRMNNIRLFDENAPSFTLAVDYEFCDRTTDATIVSCCDASGNAEGFRIHYYLSNNNNENESVRVLWGNASEIVGHGNNRGIVVLRHRKGSKNLYIASNNGGRYVYHSNSYGGDATPNNSYYYRYDAYNPNIFYTEIVRAQETVIDSVLSFGGVAYGSEGYSNPAKGWIHWAKIWYDDLGTDVIKQLAWWPHETWRMQYRGHGLYNKDDGTGLFDGASFIASAPLPQFYEMYPSTQYNTDGGWTQSILRSFVNNRCFYALPYCWQSIVKPVRITTKGGSDNPYALEYTTDRMYIPAYADMASVTQNLISSEGRQISWFTNNNSRVKFMGINIPENAQVFTDQLNDPTLYTDTITVNEGDIWITSDRAYIYVSENTATKHTYFGGRFTDDTANNIVARGPQGGLWIRSITYWTRTNNTSSNSYYHYTVYPTGSVTSTYVYYQDYQRRGVVLMFSI